MVHGNRSRANKYIVIFTSYKVQTPHYFFDFWRFLARERLPFLTQVLVLLSIDGYLFTDTT
jgi:hypothetical protein